MCCMTIAIILQIGDGLILGADSAATLAGPSVVENVYFNADKLFNLVKGLPIGAVTYGLGGLDGRSISNLAKELRERLTGVNAHPWRLDRTTYTIEKVADRVHEFFCKEYYPREFPVKRKDQSGKEFDHFESLGFLVAGYSSGATKPEIWAVEIDEKGNCGGPQLLLGRDKSGEAVVRGQPEAVFRLYRGWSPTVLRGMVDQGVPEKEAQQFLDSLPYEPLISPAMPLQDGIDLVRFMIEVTIGYVRFAPGAPTVASPIDLAAITRYEGFRWVQRKHYYTADLNRPDTHTPTDRGA